MFSVRLTQEFQDWLDAMPDQRSQVRMGVRLRQAEAGNLGGWKPVGGEVSEMRVNFGQASAVHIQPTGVTAMSTANKPIKLVPFDAARYLTDHVAVAEYMSAVLKADDPDLLLLALADIARARGMAQKTSMPLCPTSTACATQAAKKRLRPGAAPRVAELQCEDAPTR